MENDKLDEVKKANCKHCYCRHPKMWMGVGPALMKCCKCGGEKTDAHEQMY